MADEFDVIAAEGEQITVAGHAYTVFPLTIERMPGFSRALRPVLPTLGSLADIETMASDHPEDLVDIVMGIVADNGDRLIDAVAYAVAPTLKDFGATRERIGKLTTADFVLLALPVMRINADFFARRLLPAIAKAVTEAKTLGTGPTPAKP